ncbi:hypothetical protein IEQ34_015019 [Dendrobium chrysotoxum]|uniref:Uncharacterized protein n=1 Tax=Dendrobium chrysotoxum TaxID=161865 RepID=A0AAV7GNK7_DENCH|nr:hypothetical protein IEQ34_015019 [Dendrobium chrysotoxum]
MFVYKYIEAAILPRVCKWEELIHWQYEMPKYRAELAYFAAVLLQGHLHFLCNTFHVLIIFDVLQTGFHLHSLHSSLS